MEHVLRVEQFDRPLLEQILSRTEHMRIVAERGGDARLAGRILATLFYEPSTRTRLSFESAMLRLGGQVISSEMAAETSSAAKGESIEDTVRMVESYAHAIVIRHPVAGTVDAAAAVASVPVINAGDGAREHPTQALLDLYTIQRELGRIDDLTIALVGDLRYGRAPRSLAMLLTRARDIRLLFVAPPQLDMASDVLQRLDDAGVSYEIERELSSAAGVADVVYMTRVQKERFPSLAAYAEVKGVYQLTAQHVRAMRERAIVMHPLPRVDEIAPDVDDQPNAVYFQQARNGVYLRMALLDMLLNRQAGTQA
jgi:aspartate carbamoyltransferase catalytic subunit